MSSYNCRKSNIKDKVQRHLPIQKDSGLNQSAADGKRGKTITGYYSFKIFLVSDWLKPHT